MKRIRYFANFRASFISLVTQAACVLRRIVPFNFLSIFEFFWKGDSRARVLIRVNRIDPSVFGI